MYVCTCIRIFNRGKFHGGASALRPCDSYATVKYVDLGTISLQQEPKAVGATTALATKKSAGARAIPAQSVVSLPPGPAILVHLAVAVQSTKEPREPILITEK